MNLSPCPFCGSENVKVELYNTPSVVCQKCFASGPAAQRLNRVTDPDSREPDNLEAAKEEARDLWNHQQLLELLCKSVNYLTDAGNFIQKILTTPGQDRIRSALMDREASAITDRVTLLLETIQQYQCSVFAPHFERFEQCFRAQDLLDALNKPGGEEALARIGWNTKDLRRAAEASLKKP